MATEKLNVFSLDPDDPRWNLPGVAWVDGGREVYLGGHSLREAHEESRRYDGDPEAMWFGLVKADDVWNFGVVLPEGQAPSADQWAGAEAQVSNEPKAMWARTYIASCAEVLSAAQACLEVANRAVGARNKIAEHQNDGLPGTPIAIRNFTTWAEQAEQEFAPLYAAFEETCDNARRAAASLIDAADTPGEAEIIFALQADAGELDQVATVKAILTAGHGPTPSAFLEGVRQANQLMESATDGNIFTPSAAAQSDERTCPWCAETIKAAAVICRFCGRDADTQSNIG